LLQHHFVFANKSIAMDSGLEHITLPRESQMEIPRISITNLEHHLQTIRTHGQYRPTGNDLMEAQQKLKNWALKHLSFGPLLFGILQFIYYFYHYYQYHYLFFHLLFPISTFLFSFCLIFNQLPNLKSLSHQILFQSY
jgi:hypothetical protein